MPAVLSKCAGALGCTSHRPPQKDRSISFKIHEIKNQKFRMRITRFKGHPNRRTTQTTFLLFAFVIAPLTASKFVVFLEIEKRFCLDLNFCLERTRPPNGEGSEKISRLSPAIIFDFLLLVQVGRPGVNLKNNLLAF